MSGHRKGEGSNTAKFRTERFINNGDVWYYDTREGTTEGPFRTKSDAEEHLQNYVKLLNSCWWNDDVGELSLEPLNSERQPQSKARAEPQNWAVSKRS